jgi:hypothetical protein
MNGSLHIPVRSSIWRSVILKRQKISQFDSQSLNFGKFPIRDWQRRTL